MALNKSVGDLQDNAAEKQRLTETQRQSPGDRGIAAKIKAIDEQNGAMVQKADAAATEFPNSDRVQRAAGAVAIQAGDYKKGLSYADRAVALAEAKGEDPKALASALRTRATGALWSGDYPKAAEDAARVLKVFPDDKGARSIYEMSRGRTKTGAVAIATTQSRPLSNALVENSLLDDPRLRAAGQRAGDRAGANKLAAEAMRRINMGDGAGALAAANSTVATDPTLADGYMMRGLAYTILKEFSQALREFTKAIDLWSAQGNQANLPVAYARRAEAGNETRDYPNALRDAEKAVQADAGLGLGYFERARANEGLGEKGRKILDDFKRAAELAPEYAAQYASARTRLSEAAPAAAAARPLRGWLRTVTAGVSALFALIVFMAWRMSRRTRPEAVIGFAADRNVDDGPVPINEKYIRGKLVGSGGMGDVYEGQDKTLRRRVAIKRLRPELQTRERERQRFIGEAHIVAKLHHQNIVEIYDIIETPTETYIVFEYVEGRTLHEEMNDIPGRRPPLKTALECLRQISEALDHAHKRGVIHRDLKPSNVMIDENGRVKVMDFGISRVVMDTMVTTTNTIVGTPIYMAPEQSLGAVHKTMDVYSLGVSFYEMLTGGLPFKGDDLSAKMEGRFTEPSGRLPDLPPAIDAVIATALAPDARKRYQSCMEFYKAALDALRQVTPT